MDGRKHRVIMDRQRCSRVTTRNYPALFFTMLPAQYNVDIREHTIKQFTIQYVLRLFDPIQFGVGRTAFEQVCSIMVCPHLAGVHLQGLAKVAEYLGIRVVVLARVVRRRRMSRSWCWARVLACRLRVGLHSCNHVIESHDKPGQGVLGLPLART